MYITPIEGMSSKVTPVPVISREPLTRADNARVGAQSTDKPMVDEKTQRVDGTAASGEPVLERDAVSGRESEKSETGVAAQQQVSGSGNSEEGENGPPASLSDVFNTEKLQELIDAVQARATKVQFEISEEDKEIMVRVVNKETGEVVRSIPPEELLKSRQQLRELRGMLFNHVY